MIDLCILIKKKIKLNSIVCKMFESFLIPGDNGEWNHIGKWKKVS